MADDTGIRSKGKDRWEIRFSSDGEAISRMFRGTKKEAQRKRRQYLREVEQGKWRHREKTVGLLLERWFDQARRRLSPTTVRGYRHYLENRIIPALGDVPLHKLSTDDLDSFYMALEDDGLKPRSIHQCHSIIRRALRQGRIWEWLTTDPASLATLPRIPEGEISPPKPAEVHRLIATAEKRDPLMAALIFLAADTGARRGELCGIQWSDFDPIGGTVTLRRAVVDVPPLEVVVKDTKSHQRRTVALWEATVEAVSRHRLRVEEGARTALVDLAPDAYMFSREPDGSDPMSPYSVTRAFTAIREVAGVDVRFHDLRHFVGSELVGRGVPLPSVSRRLGHRLVSTTANIYAHPTDESDRKAAKVIGQLLSPGAKKTPPSRRRKPGGRRKG